MSLAWPKIVLFGDSQVQFSFDITIAPWAALLANRFQRIADVITRGFSGYTSRSGRIILPHIFYPENISDVKAFVIYLGTNDSSGKNDAPQYYVPVEEYLENLEEMIKYLESIGLNKDKIILMTPGPYQAERFVNACQKMGLTFPSKDEKLVPEYVETCLNVAKKHNLDSINLYEEMKKDEDWPRFLIDGLHFTTDGAEFIFELLKPILEKKMGASEMFMPYWQDINSVKPEDASECTILKNLGKN